MSPSMPPPEQSRQYAMMAAAAAAMGADLVRLAEYSVDELPAINVLPAEVDTLYEDANTAGKIGRFDVRHIASGTRSSPAWQTADQKYVSANKLLMADPTLGGIARIVREVKGRPEWENKELQIVAWVVTYEVEFSTVRNDPGVAGI